MRRRVASEAGETLIEIVVSVAILGLGVVALLGGLTTAVFTSDLHRKQADVSVVMTSAVEWIKEARYTTCALKADYLDSFTYTGHVVTTTSTGVAIAQAGTPIWTVDFAMKDWYGGPTFVDRTDIPTCEAFDAQGLRQQEITITAATADGKVRQEVSLVKRYRDCPPSIPLPSPGCETT